MIEVLIPIFFGTTFFFAVKTYKLSKDVKSLQKVLAEIYLKDKTEEELVNEQFLKFVSDSREWAFEYIEDVQKSMKEIVEFMEPSVLGNNKEYTDSEIVKSVYKNLKGLLPEQEDNVHS